MRVFILRKTADIKKEVMEKPMYTVKQIKALIEQHADDESYIRELLKDDTRKSVQKLMDKWNKDREKQQELHAAWKQMRNLKQSKSARIHLYCRHR